LSSKIQRRLTLLSALIEDALTGECKFFACPGPKAPIRDGLTCTRCRCLHRAIQMGLVTVVKKQYVKHIPAGDIVTCVGVLELRAKEDS